MDSEIFGFQVRIFLIFCNLASGNANGASALGQAQSLPSRQCMMADWQRFIVLVSGYFTSSIFLSLFAVQDRAGGGLFGHGCEPSGSIKIVEFFTS